MEEQAEPSPGAAAGDLSQGFCIEVSVLPDGSFKVSGPEPLAASAAEETGEPASEMGDDYTSIGEALKAVLMIIKENPVGSDENAQVEAGFGAR